MKFGKSVRKIARTLDSGRLTGMALFGGKDEIVYGDGADDSKIIDVSKEDLI